MGFHFAHFAVLGLDDIKKNPLKRPKNRQRIRSLVGPSEINLHTGSLVRRRSYREHRKGRETQTERERERDLWGWRGERARHKKRGRIWYAAVTQWAVMLIVVYSGCKGTGAQRVRKRGRIIYREIRALSDLWCCLSSSLFKFVLNFWLLQRTLAGDFNFNKLKVAFGVKSKLKDNILWNLFLFHLPVSQYEILKVNLNSNFHLSLSLFRCL